MQQKGIAHILVLILVLVAGIGIGYFALNQDSLKFIIPTVPSSNLEEDSSTAAWETYTNEQYSFKIKYNPESPPTEQLSTDDSGQFDYLLSVKFGSNPLKFPNGYELQVRNPRSIENYRLELVGHTTDAIESETEATANNITWTKLSYEIFLTTENVSITTATTNHGNYNYSITTSTTGIDQILSTFELLDNEPQPTSTTQVIENIPILSTTGWQIVSQNGISFKIPPEAYCKSDYNSNERVVSNCKYIYFNEGAKNFQEVAVEQYSGGSRRQQLLARYNSYTNCNFIYKEALFGSVKALQVSGEVGQCYHAGGIAVVVGNKLIMFPDSFYNPDTKQILRFDLLDTTISTLQPA